MSWLKNLPLTLSNYCELFGLLVKWCLSGQNQDWIIMIHSWKSALPGLLLLVLKVSHCILRKIRHVNANVMRPSHEPVSHKYLSRFLHLGTVPPQGCLVRCPRSANWLSWLKTQIHLRWDREPLLHWLLLQRWHPVPHCPAVCGQHTASPPLGPSPVRWRLGGMGIPPHLSRQVHGGPQLPKACFSPEEKGLSKPGQCFDLM